MARPAAPRSAGGATPSYGPTFWLGLMVGGAIMCYAVRGIFAEAGSTNPPGLARWVIGAAVLHDVIVAPVITAVGLLLAWILPPRVRGPVLVALALTALVVVFSWPLTNGYGRRPGNSSTLPFEYTTNVQRIVGALWVGAAVVIGWRYRRGRSAE